MDRQNPEQAAWVRETLNRYERPLVRYALRYAGDLESARDAVQETFLKLCLADRSALNGKLAGWLFTVCRNRALDMRRKARRSVPLNPAVEQQIESPMPPPAAAKEQFNQDGLNRVILATDGDFNVGETEDAALVQRIQEHAKSGVFLTVLGFGVDNLKDDRLEGLANKGNGNYYYIDSFAEANKVLVDRMAGTIAVAAKDAKIQVEFNPAKVGAYRLLGYENRALAAQDFNDDRKDAGDLGAGHTVTALYELVPVGVSIGAPGVDNLKYQPAPPSNDNPETMTVKLRYKESNASESKRIDLPLIDKGTRFEDEPADFRFAVATAAFAMLLRNSQYAGNATLETVQQVAEQSANGAPDRTEFVSLVVAAKTLRGGG